MSAFGGKADITSTSALFVWTFRGLCASLFFKNQGPEFSGALLGPLAQSLFLARAPIAPAPHSFWFSMPCPIRQIHDASDIETTHRQKCRPQFHLPLICKLDTSPFTNFLQTKQ